MLNILISTSCTTLLCFFPNTLSNIFLAPNIAILSLLSLPLLYSPIYTATSTNLFLIDSLSTPLITLSIWISFLIILSSINTLQSSTHSSNFSLWVVTLLIILIISFSFNNIISFYIIFESTIVPTTLLILGWGNQPERLQASLYFIIYTLLASLPLITSLVILSNYMGHTSIILPWDLNLTLSPLVSSWEWLIINLAFLVNLPLFLTHLWLPNAHVEAPVAGSIILAAILLNLGGYGLIRINTLFPPSNIATPILIMATALWGSALTSIICLRQTDLNALIAYSSISHIGIIIISLMTINCISIIGATSIIIAHGLSSSGLFSLANIIYENSNSRNLFISKGIIVITPATTLWWFLLLASNIATPPSLNTLSELLIFSSTLSWTNFAWIPALLTIFFTASYSLYLYTTTHHGPTPNFLNPLLFFPPINFSLSIFHLLPIILLFFHPEITII